MRSGSLRERANKARNANCAGEQRKRGREAKEREGMEGVKADNVVGVACAMTRASSVGNGQLGTVSVSVAYGSESHRGESVFCLPCQTLSFIQRRQGRKRWGEEWRWGAENELTFWALHIAIKFCLAKILTCLCHIIRNRKQQARSSFPSLCVPLPFHFLLPPATRSIKSCPCQLVWQFSALIFLSVCLCFSFSSLNENLLFSQAFPRVSSAFQLQWDNFTVIIGCCSLCRIRTCLCGFLLLVLVFVLCLSNLNFLKINFYLPKIKP